MLAKQDWHMYGAPIGECHFNAPGPVYINRSKDIDLLNMIVAWPLTRLGDFCSNFCDKNPAPEVVPEPSWWQRLVCHNSQQCSPAEKNTTPTS